MQRRQFGREFKIEAVRLIKDRGASVTQASRVLEVHENRLRRRVKLRPILHRPFLTTAR